MCDDGVISDEHSLEAPLLEMSLYLCSGGAWLVVLPVSSRYGGAHGPCWPEVVEGLWVLVALGWHAWCGRDPSAGMALVMLLLWFQW
jgi:hypothetical protein